MGQNRQKRRRNNQYTCFTFLAFILPVFLFIPIDEIKAQKLLVPSISIVGQSNDVNESEKSAQEVSTTEEEPIEKDIYNPKGKRDPFKQLIGLQVQKKKKVVPLQKYEVSQLKLTGIIWGANMKSMAMVEDPTGKGYVIKTGTLIGSNNGKVKRITKDRVIILEKYRNYIGEMKSREVSLKLYQSEEGETP
ncbi:MAG: pilus assembly protein PilP [Thermodesulfobacteriota bacterium]|nr:pilus assembly protein PilP [Thermodesulfobacteriota bacterium]